MRAAFRPIEDEQPDPLQQLHESTHVDLVHEGGNLVPTRLPSGRRPAEQLDEAAFPRIAMRHGASIFPATEAAETLADESRIGFAVATSRASSGKGDVASIWSLDR